MNDMNMAINWLFDQPPESPVSTDAPQASPVAPDKEEAAEVWLTRPNALVSLG
jgi:hypothetical protein